MDGLVLLVCLLIDRVLELSGRCWMYLFDALQNACDVRFFSERGKIGNL